MKRSLLQVTKKGLAAALMLLALSPVSQAQNSRPASGTAQKNAVAHKKKKKRRHVVHYTPGSDDPQKLKQIRAQKDKEKDKLQKK